MKSKPLIVGVVVFVVFALAGIGVAEVVKVKYQKVESTSTERDSLGTEDRTSSSVDEQEKTGGVVDRDDDADDDDEDGRSSSGNTTGTTGQSSQTLATFTLAQVATHNNAQSCYTAVNGYVYDVTSWISQHPGGRDAILSLCGKDGTGAFEGQHSGQARPANELASFKIGVLVK